MNELLDILVTTQDRPEMMQNLLDSLERQEGVCLRITVVDDASHDPFRAPALRRHSLRVIRVANSQGPTSARLDSIYDSSFGGWVIWLDDDITVPNKSTFAALKQEMDRSTNCAALAIPLCEPFRTPGGTEGFMAKLRSHARDQLRLCSFLGGSVALNRELVRSLPRRNAYKHLGGEENDLAIRILEQGWDICYANVSPVIHWVSPVRDLNRKFHFDARSAILFEYLNVPSRYLPARLFGRIAGLFVYGIKKVGVKTTIRAIFDGMRALIAARSDRRAVSLATYQKLKNMLRHGVEACSPTDQQNAGASALAGHCGDLDSELSKSRTSDRHLFGDASLDRRVSSDAAAPQDSAPSPS